MNTIYTPQHFTKFIAATKNQNIDHLFNVLIELDLKSSSTDLAHQFYESEQRFIYESFQEFKLAYNTIDGVNLDDVTFNQYVETGFNSLNGNHLQNLNLYDNFRNPFLGITDQLNGAFSSACYTLCKLSKYLDKLMVLGGDYQYGIARTLRAMLLCYSISSSNVPVLKSYKQATRIIDSYQTFNGPVPIVSCKPGVAWEKLVDSHHFQCGQVVYPLNGQILISPMTNQMSQHIKISLRVMVGDFLNGNISHTMAFQTIQIPLRHQQKYSRKFEKFATVMSTLNNHPNGGNVNTVYKKVKGHIFNDNTGEFVQVSHPVNECYSTTSTLDNQIVKNFQFPTFYIGHAGYQIKKEVDTVSIIYQPFLDAGNFTVYFNYKYSFYEIYDNDIVQPVVTNVAAAGMVFEINRLPWVLQAEEELRAQAQLEQEQEQYDNNDIIIID